MANHPNRRRGGAGHVPTHEEIREARGGLSQVEAAALIHVTQVRWSDCETGKNRMHPASWELVMPDNSITLTQVRQNAGILAEYQQS